MLNLGDLLLDLLVGEVLELAISVSDTIAECEIAGICLYCVLLIVVHGDDICVSGCGQTMLILLYKLMLLS